MEKRRILSFTLTLGIIVVVLACAGPHWTVEAKTKIPEPKIGLIDLSRIREVIPHFVALGQRSKANRQLLEAFTAQVLSEHQQQVRALNPEDYGRSRELAVAAQARIDQKRRELEENLRREEGAVLEELKAVVAHVAKKKKYDCILIKGGLQIGGEDVTDQVIKTWEKWGLSFWQRVKIFFGGKDPRPNPLAEGTVGQKQQ